MCFGFNTDLCCGLELHQLLRSMHRSRRNLLQVNLKCEIGFVNVDLDTDIYGVHYLPRKHFNCFSRFTDCIAMHRSMLDQFEL